MVSVDVVDRQSLRACEGTKPSKNPFGNLRSLSSDNFLAICCVHFFNYGVGVCAAFSVINCGILLDGVSAIANCIKN